MCPAHCTKSMAICQKFGHSRINGLFILAFMFDDLPGDDVVSLIDQRHGPCPFSGIERVGNFSKRIKRCFPPLVILPQLHSCRSRHFLVPELVS